MLGLLCNELVETSWRSSIFLRQYQSLGDPKTLISSPWTSQRTWSTPPPPPPLRIPHKKTIIKMTIRDLAYRLFCFVFCYCCLLHCGDEMRTCEKDLANSCFPLCIRYHRLPPSFCSVHSPACSLTRPKLHKIVLLRQRKMPIAIR